jgi:hypothetical protein
VYVGGRWIGETDSVDTTVVEGQLAGSALMVVGYMVTGETIYCSEREVMGEQTFH